MVRQSAPTVETPATTVSICPRVARGAVRLGPSRSAPSSGLTGAPDSAACSHAESRAGLRSRGPEPAEGHDGTPDALGQQRIDLRL